MSPRIFVQERRDKTWWDTHFMEPGQTVKFFHTNTNIGRLHKTNLQVAGHFAGDQSYLVLGVGVRAVGKTRAEEDRLLDHLFFRLQLGNEIGTDKGLSFTGTQASMTRHVFSGKELDELGEVQEATNSRLCYLLTNPLKIPKRQEFAVKAVAAPELPQGILVRVHLFGLQIRNVP